MLPLLSPSIQTEVDTSAEHLEKTSVPGFINLYRYITTQALAQDAGTKSKIEEYKNSGVEEILQDYHVKIANDAILTRALKETCASGVQDTTLPPELKDLCYNISTYLAAIQSGSLRLDDEIENLMAEEVSQFQDNLTTISKVLSTYLTNLESFAVQMLEPLTDPDKPHTKPPTSRIPSSRSTSNAIAARTYKSTAQPSPTSSSLLTAHAQTLTQLQSVLLPSLLTTLSTTLHTLLTTTSTHLTTQIRHAEVHTHSTLSRNLMTQATFLATVAQGLSLKSQILALQREKEVYAEYAVREALVKKWEALQREEKELEEREKKLRGLLGEFEAEDGKGVFETLGKGYRDVEEEIEVVKRDVERLERDVRGGKGVVGRVRR